MTNSHTGSHLDFNSKEDLLKELKRSLQIAIELEHSTLPPYLYMYWSMALHPEFSSSPPMIQKAAREIREILMEEMMHMAFACNIMRSIGGIPGINNKHAPQYPGPLPGHSKKHQFIVHLEKCDFGSVSTGIRIERPASPGMKPQGNNWDTIGQFYAWIKMLVENPLLSNEDFQHGGQMPNWSGPNSMYLYNNKANKHDPESKWHTIQSKQDALEAIDQIVEEGEGYEQTQWEGKYEHELAHFYTFLEIFSNMGGISPTNNMFDHFHKKAFVLGLKTQGNFHLDKYQEFQRYVLPMVTDPAQKKDQYSEDGLEANKAFNQMYTQMLDNMHLAFNGDLPGAILFGRMFGLQEAARKVVQHKTKDGSALCGPSFEYIPSM